MSSFVLSFNKYLLNAYYPQALFKVLIILGEQNRPKKKNLPNEAYSLVEGEYTNKDVKPSVQMMKSAVEKNGAEKGGRSFNF